MKVDRNLEAKTLTISQSVYTQKALESMGMLDCKSAATPMAENPNLVANPETANPSSVRNYQSAIGTLNLWPSTLLVIFTTGICNLTNLANPSPLCLPTFFNTS